MRLEYICSSCKKSNYYFPVVPSRADLHIKMGNEVNVICKNCGKHEKKHLNRIRAVVDNRLLIGGFVAGVFLILLLGGYMESKMQEDLSFWRVVGIAGSAATGIPMFLWNRENKAVRKFNRYAIKK